jgi:hypothetical protein
MLPLNALNDPSVNRAMWKVISHHHHHHLSMRLKQTTLVSGDGCSANSRQRPEKCLHFLRRLICWRSPKRTVTKQQSASVVAPFKHNQSLSSTTTKHNLLMGLVSLPILKVYNQMQTPVLQSQGLPLIFWKMRCIFSCPPALPIAR